MPYQLDSMRESIPHYHGDIVRVLFFATAVLSFLAIPFWGHVLPFGSIFEIIGGIALIALAGITNPHSKSVLLWDAVVSGLGAFLFELAAVSFRAMDSLQLLLVREVAAVLLVTALYFSLKTLRAMYQGTVGELPRPWEFESVVPDEQNEQGDVVRNTEENGL